MAAEGVTAQNGFIPASASSEWYKNLNRRGSCLRLYDLLVENPQLLRETGPEGVTVLHKGVRHGCVKLVRYILVDMFGGEGDCKCALHEPTYSCLTRDDLLRKTCFDGVTAVHMAMVSGSPKMVLLMKWAIEMSRYVKRCGSAEQVPVQESCAGLLDERRMSDEEIQSLFFGEEAATQNSNVTEDVPSAPVVPNVKDEGIDGIYSNSDLDTRVRKVYAVIHGVLDNPDTDKEAIQKLKDACRRDVDFEFSPVSQVFLHFLSSVMGPLLRDYEDSDDYRRDEVEVCERIMGQIIRACNRCDVKEGAEGAMLKTLFNLHDPQGRTFLRVAFDDIRHSDFYPTRILESILQTMKSDDISPPISSKTIAKCLNATDASGCTLLHFMCIRDYTSSSRQTRQVLMQYMDYDAMVTPLLDEHVRTLRKWCYPAFEGWFSYTSFFPRPIHLIVLFNSICVFAYLFSDSKFSMSEACYKFPYTYAADPGFIAYGFSSPFQIAAYLGRTRLLERMFESHRTYNGTKHTVIDKGNLPAIHCAALSGQVESIQSILKYPTYDPIIEHIDYGTALHFAVKQSNFKLVDLKLLQVIAFCFTLPNSEPYKLIQKDFIKCDGNEDERRMYSANEKSCINLLLQAGIDIWTHQSGTNQFPHPGPMANDEANSWWYEKVVKEVVDAKTSISYAANATSVVAALVATASFIGPFQPPLGYATPDGYVQADRSPVRVYLVCNSLSFFFSVASILMSLLPAIPMPKESLYDELLRSQRCLKAAALMLLVSIMCVLISFSSASIAVVSSEWQQKQLVVACIVCGGAVCVVVLFIYVIRLLRMLFHKNARLRRGFAKYMYF